MANLKQQTITDTAWMMEDGGYPNSLHVILTHFNRIEEKDAWNIPDDVDVVALSLLIFPR
jgi:hypothetical protein